MPLLAMCQPAVFQFYLAFCPLISNTLPSTSVYLFCIRSVNASLYMCMPTYMYKNMPQCFNNLSDLDNRYRKFPLMDDVMLFMYIFEKQHCLLCVKS